MCLPDALEPADVAKIIATANAAEPKLTKLVLGVLAGEKGCHRDGQSCSNCRCACLPYDSSDSRSAAAVEAIRRHWSCQATTAVILGTGLGELADEVTASATIAYRDIPGFPARRLWPTRAASSAASWPARRSSCCKAAAISMKAIRLTI